MLPLEGLLVVALEQAVAAPTCTVRLADAGARVIKIERENGETARHYDKTVKGTSAYFAWLNRGKESAVLDIKDEADRALVERMVARADVSIQNFAPGAAARLGLDAAGLVARHPKLIERSITGRGKAVEIALFEAMADMMSVPLFHLEHAGQDTPRTGLSHAAIFPYNSIDCADGQIVVVVQNPAEWQRFCAGVLRMPELAEDPRFFDNPLRVVHRDELLEIMKGVFGKLSRKAAIERLETNRLAWSNVSSVADLSAHPALRRVHVDTPGGDFDAVGSPVRRALKGGAVPALGEHTQAIRREFAEGT